MNQVNERLEHPGFRNDPADAGAGNGGGDAGAAVASGSVEGVANLITLLGKAARASQLYRSDNPMYHRFVSSLREAFAAMWDRQPALGLRIQEHGFEWEDESIGAEGGRDGLAFLFYKDGVRQLKFLPGFEADVDRFLELLARARRVDAHSDDMITLLWEADFDSLQYAFVESGPEGLNLPEPGDGVLEPIGTDLIQAEFPEVGELDPELIGRPDAPAPGAQRAGLTAEDFEETLYLLDDVELDELEAELDREWDRDVKGAVIAALFDRIEDPKPERQREIIGILRQVLPSSLAAGDFAAAANILTELRTLLTREPAVLVEEIHSEVDALFEELSEPELVEQLVQALDQVGTAADGGELVTLVSQLRAPALPGLIRASQTVPAEWLRGLLARAAESMAGEWPDRLIPLLDDVDPLVAAGAARLAGSRRVAEATQPLIRLLESEEVILRRAAVDALILLRTAPALAALQGALEDPDKEARIAAARGLGTLRHRASRERFEKVLSGRTLRGADLSERIAMFEAYGDLGAPESVSFLDRLLNGRRFPGRRHPQELRACAALALGRLGVPAASRVLARAESDPDPIVKTAVARALRGEEAGQR